MFDISFFELVVIGIVALVVIGPERMPKVARTVGLLLGRAQRYVSTVKADISREMQLDELKKLQSDIQESASDFEKSINQELQTLEKNAEQTVETIKADMPSLTTTSEAMEQPGSPAPKAIAENKGYEG